MHEKAAPGTNSHFQYCTWEEEYAMYWLSMFLCQSLEWHLLALIIHVLGHVSMNALSGCNMLVVFMNTYIETFYFFKENIENQKKTQKHLFLARNKCTYYRNERNVLNISEWKVSRVHKHCLEWVTRMILTP